mgnify:CR=1 FL=1
MNGYAVAFTFPCHPAKYLRPERAPPLLMSPREKVIMLESFGIDHVILREFDDELAEDESGGNISASGASSASDEGSGSGRGGSC